MNKRNSIAANEDGSSGLFRMTKSSTVEFFTNIFDRIQQPGVDEGEDSSERRPSQDSQHRKQSLRRTLTAKLTAESEERKRW